MPTPTSATPGRKESGPIMAKKKAPPTKARQAAPGSGPLIKKKKAPPSSAKLVTESKHKLAGG